MKQIVIIGGGFAGSHIAKALESEFAVTLIDAKDYFEFTPGILRTLVDPRHLARIETSHLHYLKHAKVIVSHVTELSEHEVVVDGRQIPFDYAVICSGSGYKAPFKDEKVISASRARQLRDYTGRLKDAKKILLIGGGLVSVELAGEISDAYPDKKITIVHSENRILQRNTPRVIKAAGNYLKRRGVTFILNERVITSSPYTTDKGTKIEADLAFLCTGIHPNHGFIPKNMLNEKKFVRVNDYLQCLGYSHIFAAGDITDRPEEKTAQNAEKQADVVIHNIRALERNTPLSVYRPSPRPMVISLGKYNGILLYKSFSVSGIIPAFLKWAVEKREMIKKKSI